MGQWHSESPVVTNEHKSFVSQQAITDSSAKRPKSCYTFIKLDASKDERQQSPIRRPSVSKSAGTSTKPGLSESSPSSRVVLTFRCSGFVARALPQPCNFFHATSSINSFDGKLLLTDSTKASKSGIMCHERCAPVAPNICGGRGEHYPEPPQLLEDRQRLSLVAKTPG